MTWLRAVERLSRSGPSEVADAHLHLRELVGFAQALGPAVAQPHDCGGQGCPFDAIEEAAPLCALVGRLAVLDVAPLPADVDGQVLVEAFVGAVADAAETVRWCRVTAHPGGGCWFLSSRGGGGCGDVLRLSHRLG